MIKDSCNCNPPAVVSNIMGERCHVTDERGTWCAIENEGGIYRQELLERSPEEIARDEEFQTRIATENAAHDAKVARQNELKTRLKNGENLSVQELSELLVTLL